MIRKENTYPIAALFGSESEPNKSLPVHPRDIVKGADLIVGVDVMSRNQFLVFGRKKLEKIVRTGESAAIRVIAVELDQESDELEKLIALVTVLKGRHDYRSSDGK